MGRTRDEADLKRIENNIITVVLSIILTVLSWEVLTAILPFVLEYPTHGLVTFTALGVFGWALRRRILYSVHLLQRFFHEARVNIMLSVCWEKRDIDETLEALEPIKIKQHRKVPSLQQRQASASASAGIGIPPATPPTPPCKTNNGTIHRRK